MYLCSWSLHGHCVFLTVLARTLGILNRQTYAFRDYPCTKSLRIAGGSYRICSNAYRTLFFDPFIFLRVGTYYILYHIYDLFHIFIPVDYDLKVLVPAKNQGEHQRSCAGDEPQVARRALKPLARTGRPGQVTSAEGVSIRAVDHRTSWRWERADPEARGPACAAAQIASLRKTQGFKACFLMTRQLLSGPAVCGYIPLMQSRCCLMHEK